MTLVDFLPAKRDRSWDLARPAGVTHAVAKCAPELTGRPAPDNLDALHAIQCAFADAGLTLIGFEGDEFDMQRIKLGLGGRDDDIARYQKMLRNMGELGLSLLCYNFMATIGWFRTATAVPAFCSAHRDRAFPRHRRNARRFHGDVSRRRTDRHACHAATVSRARLSRAHSGRSCAVDGRREDLPHGYALLGRLFAVGYMKGILDTAGIPYR